MTAFLKIIFISYGYFAGKQVCGALLQVWNWGLNPLQHSSFFLAVCTQRVDSLGSFICFINLIF